MVSMSPDYSNNIQTRVQAAFTARQLSRQEHLRLTSAMLSNFNMHASERSYINRLLDQVRAGKIRLTD